MQKQNIRKTLEEIEQMIKDKTLHQSVLKKKLDDIESVINEEKTKIIKTKNLEQLEKKLNELILTYQLEFERSLIIIDTDGEEEQRHKNEMTYELTKRNQNNNPQDFCDKTNIKSIGSLNDLLQKKTIDPDQINSSKSEDKKNIVNEEIVNAQLNNTQNDLKIIGNLGSQSKRTIMIIIICVILFFITGIIIFTLIIVS